MTTDDFFGKIKHKFNACVDVFNFYFNPGTAKEIHLEMNSGIFEPKITDLIKNMLVKCDIFVDVGANIGYYSKIASDAGKYVISIEPQIGNVKKLYDNVNKDKCEVYPVGLGDTPKILTLYGASSVSASVIPKWAHELNFIKQTIPISTLDIILGYRFKNSKILIKIDTEGYEYNVLLGAIKTLNRNVKPIWIIEICNGEYDPSGINQNYQDTFDLMSKFGYKVDKIDSFNYLFTPKD